MTNIQQQLPTKLVPIGRVIRAMSMCSFIEDKVDNSDHSIQEFLDALASPMRPQNAKLLGPVVEAMVDKLGINEEDYYPSLDTLELTLIILKRFAITDYFNRELRPTNDED